MKWSARVFLWMLLLAIPCWLLSTRYQRVLGIISESLLLWTGRRVSIFHLQVYAPMDLGLYTAMCLASVRSKSMIRIRALLLGIPLLAGIQIAVIVLSAIPAILLSSEGFVARGAPRLMGYAIQTIVWVSAPCAWLLFLGSSELVNPEPVDTIHARRGRARKHVSSKRGPSAKLPPGRLEEPSRETMAAALKRISVVDRRRSREARS